MSLFDGFWFWMGRWLVDILQFVVLIVVLGGLVLYFESKDQKRRDEAMRNQDTHRRNG